MFILLLKTYVTKPWRERDVRALQIQHLVHKGGGSCYQRQGDSMSEGWGRDSTGNHANLFVSLKDRVSVSGWGLSRLALKTDAGSW